MRSDGLREKTAKSQHVNVECSDQKYSPDPARAKAMLTICLNHYHTEILADITVKCFFFHVCL